MPLRVGVAGLTHCTALRYFSCMYILVMNIKSGSELYIGHQERKRSCMDEKYITYFCRVYHLISDMYRKLGFITPKGMCLSVCLFDVGFLPFS